MKNFWNSLRENFNFLSVYCLLLVLSLPMLLGFHGCQKEPGSIGLNLRDRDNLLNAVFTDTITLTAHSALDDTLNTRNLTDNFLGFIRDPVFGITSTGIFTQLIPSGNSVNFGSSPQLDSIVLVLRYSGSFYGDTLNPFIIKVHRLTEDISSIAPYYQNHLFAYSSENLTYQSEFHLYPKPRTKVKLDTIVEAHARIRLSDELGNLLLRSTSQISSNEVFIRFFKGLYIYAKPLTNNGSLVNFNLRNAMSGIQLYYKNDTIPRQFQFKTNETVRVSNYEHDYEAGNQNFVNQVIRGDSLLGKEMLYVQCMGGVKTIINFPHIKTFKDKNIVINKAELVITDIGDDPSAFPPPNRLNINRISIKGDIEALPDAGTYYWGGTYNATTKEYRFRITRYIQDIILREDYRSCIYLVADRKAADAYRLVLNGTHPVDPASRLRLEVYYTEY